MEGRQGTDTSIRRDAQSTRSLASEGGASHAGLLCRGLPTASLACQEQKKTTYLNNANKPYKTIHKKIILRLICLLKEKTKKEEDKSILNIFLIQLMTVLTPSNRTVSEGGEEI